MDARAPCVYFASQAHLENRRSQHYSIAKLFTRPDGSKLLYIGHESIMPGRSGWPMPHDAPYMGTINLHLMAVVEVQWNSIFSTLSIISRRNDVWQYRLTVFWAPSWRISIFPDNFDSHNIHLPRPQRRLIGFSGVFCLINRAETWQSVIRPLQLHTKIPHNLKRILKKNHDSHSDWFVREVGAWPALQGSGGEQEKAEAAAGGDDGGAAQEVPRVFHLASSGRLHRPRPRLCHFVFRLCCRAPGYASLYSQIFTSQV